MHNNTKIKLLQTELHMQNYMDDEESTAELREMCKRCERYCGKEHDYKECRNELCFQFWLAYTCLDLESGYE